MLVQVGLEPGRSRSTVQHHSTLIVARCELAAYGGRLAVSMS